MSAASPVQTELADAESPTSHMSAFMPSSYGPSAALCCGCSGIAKPPAGTEQRVICTVPLSRAASPVCVSHTSQQTHPSEDLMIPPGFTCTLPFSAQRPKLSGGREWNRRRVSSRIGCLSTPTADSPAVGGASKKRRTMMAKARITILKQTFQADILEREIRDEAFRDSSSSYPSFGKGRPRSPKTGRPCPTASANEHGRTFDRRLRW